MLFKGFYDGVLFLRLTCCSIKLPKRSEVSKMLVKPLNIHCHARSSAGHFSQQKGSLPQLARRTKCDSSLIKFTSDTPAHSTCSVVFAATCPVLRDNVQHLLPYSVLKTCPHLWTRLVLTWLASSNVGCWRCGAAVTQRLSSPAGTIGRSVMLLNGDMGFSSQNCG
jgi:hypothetical protein